MILEFCPNQACCLYLSEVRQVATRDRDFSAVGICLQNVLHLAFALVFFLSPKDVVKAMIFL